MTDRVAIVGAREASPETLEKVREYVRALPEGTIVVSGGARGVDLTATIAARESGLSTVEYRPSVSTAVGTEIQSRVDMSDAYEWEPHCWLGKVSLRDALIFRNTLIAVDCSRMVAFAQGSKGGTWDAVKQAERFKRPVEIVR